MGMVPKYPRIFGNRFRFILVPKYSTTPGPRPCLGQSYYVTLRSSYYSTSSVAISALAAELAARSVVQSKFSSVLSKLCPSTAGSNPPPESSNFLCPLLSLSIPQPFAPQCHLSKERPFDLPTDLTPFISHSVLLMVHLLSLILVMCPAHSHFSLGCVLDCVCVSGSLLNDDVTDCLLAWDLAFSFP